MTTQATDAAKDQLRRELHGVREILEQRLDGMDEATRLIQAWRDLVPGLIEGAIRRAQDITTQQFRIIDEKFTGVQVQFQERDERTRSGATATKTAVDAAFQAQKDMVSAQNAFLAQALSRIEAVAQRQGEQMMTLLESKVNALDSKISDQKDRLSLIEGRTAGITAAGTTQREQVVTQQGSSNLTLTMVAIAISIVFGIGAMLISFMKS